MSKLALLSIRILRHLPITPAFDRHLSACVMMAAFTDRRLQIAHVLGLRPVFLEGIGLPDAGDEGIHAAEFSADDRGWDHGPVVGDGVNFQHGTKTVH